MPLLKLETTLQLSQEMRNQLLVSLSKIVAKNTGKPEQYVMVTIHEVSILMAGEGGDAAFVEIRSIGELQGQVNENLSRDICSVLQEILGIDPKRIYLNFFEVAAANWGWDGTRFGT